MMAAKAQPIIVIKKKGGHGGHHGGAWKVAYADFVTAMMALFIVLWLMGSERTSEESRGRILQRSERNRQAAWHHDVGNRRRRCDRARRKREATADLKEKLEKEIKARKELEKLSSRSRSRLRPKACALN